MANFESGLRRAAAALCLIAAAAVTCAAQAPAVSKVEPPDWWAGHSVNPVRVMLRGQNLGGARVEAMGQGIRTGLVRVNDAGTYAFVDVFIDKDARPGRRQLRVSTAAGTAEADFAISEPLPRAGRFQGFTPDDVIYFIMPDRFADGDRSNNDPAKSPGLYDRSKGRYYHGGDFQGIIDHLPYLKELGVTAVWINPVYDNTDRPDEKEMYPETEGGPRRPTTAYHGYGAIDFYGVEEHYGSMQKLKELVEKAHALGIKVIQDQIANHTSPYHPWVNDRPTPTWFYGTVDNHLSNNWQKWTTMDPHASEETRRRNLEGWFIDILPDLNQDDEEVRRYLIQNTLWWLGTVGFDAVRMDTLPHVPRRFWRDWSAAIHAEYPSVNILGELFDGDPALLSYFQRGRVGRDGIDTGIDTVYDFALHYAIRDAFAKGEPVRKLQQVLAHDYLYPHPETLVPFIGVHDMQRFMNEQGATVEGLKLAQTFLLTTRGTPLLYYGDELAMPGGGDPDNRRDFPGGFPNDARNAFTKAGRTAVENDVFEHVKRLTKLRAELPALRRGSLVQLYDEEQQTAYARVLGGEAVVVAINNDTRAATFEFDVSAAGVPDAYNLTDRLGVIGGATRVAGGRVKVTLPARSASLFATTGNTPPSVSVEGMRRGAAQ
ncbi:MAG: cyclomaltodextrinase N-terminal domain-containing protein [Acidobacteria bacterium]|nr:cyclomaltodextrinase N-terminal domain-containing protein [Acidobacteriota bacterium]